MPAVPRHMLFKGIVVPIRSGKVSKLYDELWMEDGSPLKVYGESVAKGVQEQGLAFGAFAPSSNASKTVQRNDGFKGATTIAELLVNEIQGSPNPLCKPFYPDRF